MTRPPDLSLKCAEATSVQGAAGFNKLQVELFFDKLSELTGKHHFPPSRIYMEFHQKWSRNMEITGKNKFTQAGSV